MRVTKPLHTYFISPIPQDRNGDIFRIFNQGRWVLPYQGPMILDHLLNKIQRKILSVVSSHPQFFLNKKLCALSQTAFCPALPLLPLKTFHPEINLLKIFSPFLKIKRTPFYIFFKKSCLVHFTPFEPHGMK